MEIGKVCHIEVKELGEWKVVARSDGRRFRQEAIEVCCNINEEIHEMALVRARQKQIEGK